MSKYDDLLELCWKLYDDEIARFRALDNKAARYLSAYSILVAFVGFVFASLRLATDQSGNHFWVKLNYVLLALLIVAYCMSFLFVVRSFRQMNTKRLRRDRTWIEFVKHEEHDDLCVQLELSEKLRQAAEDNVRVGDEKSRNLARARMLSFSWPMMLLLIASLLLAMYNGSCVSGGGALQKNVQAQRKPAVTVPENVWITEGGTPPSDRRGAAASGLGELLDLFLPSGRRGTGGAAAGDEDKQ